VVGGFDWVGRCAHVAPYGSTKRAHAGGVLVVSAERDDYFVPLTPDPFYESSFVKRCEADSATASWKALIGTTFYPCGH
jgi:hypothetical protein